MNSIRISEKGGFSLADMPSEAMSSLRRPRRTGTFATASYGRFAATSATKPSDRVENFLGQTVILMVREMFRALGFCRTCAVMNVEQVVQALDESSDKS